jgi:hypothetical protein
MATTKKKASPRSVGLKYGFRSGLEERFAAELTAFGVEFEFEQTKFEYKKPETKHKYTPDFILRTRRDGTPRLRPLIIETKGRFMTADRQKHLLMKRQHPHLDIRFIFSNPNQKISKQSKTTYASWCDKHGYLYAKEHVPPAWLEE